MIMDNDFNNTIENTQNEVTETTEKVGAAVTDTVDETAEQIGEKVSEAAERTTEAIEKPVEETAENLNDTAEEMAIDSGFFESAPIRQPEVIPSSEPQYTQPVQQPAKKEKTGKGFFIGSLICLLLCATALVFTLLAGRNNTAEKPDEKQDPQQKEEYKVPESDTPEYKPVVDEDGRYDAPSLIAKVNPSVLLVSTEKGFGTGFVFTADGYIITNEHVISGYKNAKLKFYDGTEADAKVVGSDSSLDIAVLKCEINGLEPLELADSSKVVPGEYVIAIGNPYDKSLTNTASEGIVSAIRYNYHFEELQSIADVIQHTASINSGNSGGPLFNMYGQVIGINAVKISGYENLGFAIAINSVKTAIGEIITYGTVQRPTLGITCQTNPNIGGVTVVEVNAGSAAEKAGLKVNDVITKFDGERIKTSEELKKILEGYSAGDVIEITILRDVDSFTLTLTLDKAFENTQEE